MANLHWAITHRVKPGREAEFEQKLHAFAQASMGENGMIGVHLLHPFENAASNEYGILRSFDSEADAERFYGSKLFADWKASVLDLIEGEPSRRQMSGLEAFFRSESRPMPKRWKMAIVTFLGVLPSVLLWSSLLPALLTGLHWLAVAVVVNAAVVATLTWIVMPWLTRIFHNWLQSDIDPPNLTGS